MTFEHGPPIQVDPGKLGGTPTITGTRMPVRGLIVHLVFGGNIDEFADESGLDIKEIRSVLQFAVDDLGNDPSVADRARAWMDEKLRRNDQEDDAWELS